MSESNQKGYFKASYLSLVHLELLHWHSVPAIFTLFVGILSKLCIKLFHVGNMKLTIVEVFT